MAIPKFVQIACGQTGDNESHDHVLYALDEEGRVWLQDARKVDGVYHRFWRLDSQKTEDEVPAARAVAS